MRIGYAGPVAFDLLRDRLRPRDREAYGGSRFPQGSLLINALHDAGHHLEVVTLDHEQRAEGPLELEGERLRVQVLPYRERLRWVDAFRVEIGRLADALGRAGPDVIHAQWSYEYALAAMATGRPHLVTVRDWAPLIARMQRRPLAWVYRVVRAAMNDRVLRHAQCLTVTSPYMVELVRRRYGREPALVPNALPGEAFDDGRTADEADAPVVLSISNAFDHRKNVEALLRALPAVRARVPGARLRLVGGPFAAGGPADAWSRRQGLAEGVDFVGTLAFPSVLDELSRAAVLAHPSREESFGGTLLEAMARGTPVVAGRTSGAAPWVLDGGRAGVLTDVEDPGCIADAVTGLLLDRERAQRMANAGRVRARDFSLQRTAAAYEEIYRDLAGTPDTR